jgi:hypothetical protein
MLTDVALPTDRFTWHEAASQAAFVAYHARTDGGSVWAGGFAGDGSHLGVISTVDGVEVSVDTAGLDERHTEHTMLTAAMHDLWFHRSVSLGEIELPLVVEFLADDREHTVDDVARTFRGVRIEGDPRWIGFCDLDGIRLTMATTSAAGLTLSPLPDPMALPEFPPD